MDADLIEGRGGDDVLIGGGDIDGVDTIDGGAGNDRIRGGAGNDIVRGGSGKDVLDGGANFSGFGDTVSYEGSSAGVTVRLGVGSAVTAGKGGDAEGDQITGFESIIGSDFQDVLKASALNNSIDAGKGDDFVLGIGEPITGVQFDAFDGGDDIDTLSFSGALSALNLILDTGTVTATSYFANIANFEIFIGGSGNDFMFAKFDGSSPVTFIGGAGRDTIRGGGGHDILDGGSGADTLVFAASTPGVSVDLLTNVVSGAGNDTIMNFENVSGTSLGDTLRGNNLANALHGMDGNDVIEGRAGADKLDGGGGNNTLSYASSVAGVTVSLGTEFSWYVGIVG
jgi:Ca2+-binding RTX toxin-like protein